jgi:hypothetical protein
MKTQINIPRNLRPSWTEAAAAEFYPVDRPAKLVIQIPSGTPMATFEHDSGSGEEQECLLPRGRSLEVTFVEEITDLRHILLEQCTSGRPWLTNDSTLIKVQLRLCAGCDTGV